jgi:hypothetical protein
MLRLLIEDIDGGRVKRLSAGHADHYMSSSRMSALKLILLKSSESEPLEKSCRRKSFAVLLGASYFKSSRKPSSCFRAD